VITAQMKLRNLDAQREMHDHDHGERSALASGLRDRDIVFLWSDDECG
jgi:hypothetical protein